MFSVCIQFNSIQFNSIQLGNHNRVFRLDVTRFVAKKTGVTKTQYVLLGICDAYFTC